MRLVVADTGPINYLILIGHIDLLPALFKTVLVPTIVQNELTSDRAPAAVRQWVAVQHAWLEVHDLPDVHAEDISLRDLDAGEKAAIQLATALHADLLLMDDRKGVSAATRKGLRVTGTLGVLDLAATDGLISFTEAIKRLERTTFHRPQALLRALLRKHSQAGGSV